MNIYIVKGKDVKVSIVIPVYNVADYITHCLDTVSRQTYKNIEVILVDDCGTDTSMQLVTEYIARHDFPEYRIVKHEHNRGLSAARNTGIAEATGDYVYFLDSDDWIALNCVAILVKPLEEQMYDFVLGNYADVRDDEREYPALSLLEGGLSDNKSILHAYMDGLWYVMAWNKLCRKSFLLENDLTFDEGILHEDVVWSFKLAFKAQSMYAVQRETYFYNIREASIMTSMSIEKDVQTYLKAFSKIVSFIRQEGRECGLYEYIILEGKKSTILFSLLQSGNKVLYNKYYPEMVRLHYVSPLRLLRYGRDGWKLLLRDGHYCLPVWLGRLYKRFFYTAAYQWSGKQLQGKIWK